MPIYGLRRPVIAALALLIASCSDSGSQTVEADITLFVSGDLLEKGGVAFVDPLPVGEAEWAEIVAEQNRSLPPPGDLKPIAPGGKRITATLTSPASHVQFLYPEGRRKYTFRFRPDPSADPAKVAAVGSRVLTIGGIDGETGLGPAAEIGFVGRHTSGRQIIQVATPGTEPVEGRALIGAIEHPAPEPPETPTCTMQSALAICGYDAGQWERIERRWRTNHKNSLWEQRRWTALNACYRDAERRGRTGGHCHQLTPDGEDPIRFEHRERGS